MALKSPKAVRSMPKAVGFGLIVNLMVTFAAAVIVAVLVSKGVVEESAGSYGSGVALLLSAFLGALAAGAKVGEKRMLTCIINGIVYFLCLLCITAMFFDGAYKAVGVSCLVILGSSIAAGMLGLKTKGNTMRKGKKLRF